MQTRILLLAAVVVACAAGFMVSKRQGVLAAPAEVKAITCQPGARYLVPGAVDVFAIRDVSLALACQQYGTGKLMVEQWRAEEKRNPGQRNAEAFFQYGFSKRPDGHFERDGNNDQLPLSGRAQYVVQTTVGDNVAGPLDPAFHRWDEEMSTPTPPAFAETGSETRWSCQGPKQHRQTRYECTARVRSGSLPWHIHITFGFPQKDEFDVKPEVMEAYRLLAAHVIR